MVLPLRPQREHARAAGRGGRAASTRGSTGTGEQWFSFIKDAFDRLLREGARHPKMMSIGLHMRLIGHPARATGLERLLDYIGTHDGVWITRRVDIARHWIATHPYPGHGLNEACPAPGRAGQKPR